SRRARRTLRSPPRCCACTPTGCSSRNGNHVCWNASPARIPASRCGGCPRWPPTSTTSTACGTSELAWQAREPRGAHRARQTNASSSAARGRFVLALGGLQQVPPVVDLGTFTQQRTALAFGHASPHAEVDAVVEGFGETFGPHGAAHADDLRAILFGATDEQPVRVGVPAVRLDPPARLVGAHHNPQLLPCRDQPRRRCLTTHPPRRIFLCSHGPSCSASPCSAAS